jgi:hypothetical protein
MSVDCLIDAMRLREQMTRAEREASAKGFRATVQEHDQEIEIKRAEPRLAMFEPNRAVDIARLQERRAMIARQLEVTELSLTGPG